MSMLFGKAHDDNEWLEIKKKKQLKHNAMSQRTLYQIILNVLKRNEWAVPPKYIYQHKTK